MGYVCKNCNFRFENKNKECLYCGKGDGIEKEKNASELIDEVSNLLYSR